MKPIAFRVRASWKLAGVLLHLVRGSWTVVLVFPGLTTPKKQERIRALALALLALLAIFAIKAVSDSSSHSASEACRPDVHPFLGGNGPTGLAR